MGDRYGIHYSFILFLSQLTVAFYSGTVDKNKTYSNTRTYRRDVSSGESETSVDTSLVSVCNNKRKLSSSTDRLAYTKRTDLTPVEITLDTSITADTVDLTHEDDAMLNGNGGDDASNDLKDSDDSDNESDAFIATLETPVKYSYAGKPTL